MGEIWKIIQVILLSSVKFVAGPPFAYFDQRYNFSFFETVGYSVFGGMLGVFAFTFFSEKLHDIWMVIKFKFNQTFGKKETFSEPVADVDIPVVIHYEYIDKKQEAKKVFTKRNRRIVKIWLKYGLSGIAIVTPIILSIPLGTLIANNLESNKKKIFLYMFISILSWSILMTSLFEIFHANNVRDLQEQIIK